MFRHRVLLLCAAFVYSLQCSTLLAVPSVALKGEEWEDLTENDDSEDFELAKKRRWGEFREDIMEQLKNPEEILLLVNKVLDDYRSISDIMKEHGETGREKDEYFQHLADAEKHLEEYRTLIYEPKK